MRSASRKPRVVTSSVGSPLRSSSALVATVVPIFTHSTTLGRDRLAGLQAQQVADAGDGRVAVLLGVFRQQLVRDQRAVGPLGDDVGEGAAAVDPELPLGAGCALHWLIVLVHGILRDCHVRPGLSCRCRYIPKIKQMAEKGRT